MPDFYEKNRRVVVAEKFVQIYGTVQNQDGIVHLRAEQIAPLRISDAQVVSHDFH
jgi:error-prone DNA polymerase